MSRTAHSPLARLLVLSALAGTAGLLAGWLRALFETAPATPQEQLAVVAEPATPEPTEPAAPPETSPEPDGNSSAVEEAAANLPAEDAAEALRQASRRARQRLHGLAEDGS